MKAPEKFTSYFIHALTGGELVSAASPDFDVAYSYIARALDPQIKEMIRASKQSKMRVQFEGRPILRPEHANETFIVFCRPLAREYVAILDTLTVSLVNFLTYEISYWGDESKVKIETAPTQEAAVWLAHTHLGLGKLDVIENPKFIQTDLKKDDQLVAVIKATPTQVYRQAAIHQAQLKSHLN